MTRPLSALRFTPISREAVAALFEQAMIGFDQHTPGSWLDTLETYTRLVEAELQGQVFANAHRKSLRTGETYRKRMPNFG